jgi:hypothetical protein
MSKNSVTVGNVFTIPLRSAYRLLVSCLAYPSIRKMVAVHSSETSVDFYRATRSCIAEDKVTAVRNSKPKLEKTMYHGCSDLSGILTDVTEYLCRISHLWPRETRHSLSALYTPSSSHQCNKKSRSGMQHDSWRTYKLDSLGRYR